MTATVTDLELPGRLVGPDGKAHRAAEIEHIDPDQGTVLVRVAPYDHEVQLDRDLWEAFEPRAFEAATRAPHRVMMWLLHDDGQPPIGHAEWVEDRPDGSWVQARFSNTTRGRDARELARDKTLGQVSVTFEPRRDWMKVDKRADGLHVRHRRAYMRGFALVPHGAYGEEAFVAQVRGVDETRARRLLERQREERRRRLLGLTH